MSAAAAVAASAGGITGSQSSASQGGEAGEGAPAPSGGSGNGSIGGGTMNDRGLLSAVGSFRRGVGGKGQGQPAQPTRRAQAPAAPAAPPRAAPKPTAPARAPAAPAAQTGDNESDVASGSRLPPAKHQPKAPAKPVTQATEDDDPTARAYELPDAFDEQPEPEAGTQNDEQRGEIEAANENELGGGQQDEQAQTDEDTGEQNETGAGQSETGASDPYDQLALDAFGAVFGLNPGLTTPAHRDAIISDVEAVLGKPTGAPQPAAASPPTAPAAPQSRPPAPPAPAPGQQPSAAAPAQSATGPATLEPLSDDQIKTMGEQYGAPIEALARSHNTLIQALRDRTAQNGEAELRQQVQALQTEAAYSAAQPVVAEFMEGWVKQGFPEIPRSQWRELTDEAARYMRSKAQQGHNLTDTQALSAVCTWRTAEDIQKKASQAREEGKKEVVQSLRKRTRSFDVAGGPGSVPASATPPDPNSAILNASRNWRQQANQPR